MPPPERPCGRTPSAPKCSSCASVVMKQRVSSPVASSTAPTTSSPSLSEMTSHSSRPSTSGLTRLTMPSRVPRARPGTLGGQRGERQRALAALELQHLAERQAALEVGVVGRVGQLGHVEHAEPQQPPARGDHADLAARRRTDRGDDDVVVGAALALAGDAGVARAGQQPAGGEVGEARVVGHLERGARPWRSRRSRRAGPYDAGCRRSWRPRRARRRRPSAASSRRRGSRRAARWCARSSAFSLSSSSLLNFVSRRSGMSRM